MDMVQWKYMDRTPKPKGDLGAIREAFLEEVSLVPISKVLWYKHGKDNSLLIKGLYNLYFKFFLYWKLTEYIKDFNPNFNNSSKILWDFHFVVLVYVRLPPNAGWAPRDEVLLSLLCLTRAHHI